MNMIIFSITVLSMMFTMVNHPLSMVILIILQTLLICLMMGMMMKSFWFSYIIMIIMMSGMLVLFIYMASIASNEKFKFSFKMIMFLPMSATLMFYLNMEYHNLTDLNDLKLNLQSLFNYPSMLLTIMMTIYLLYSMITISKIVNIHEGPLRIKK